MEDVEEVLVRLRTGREKPLLRGHPWLFSGAIAAAEGPPTAPLARVVSAAGEVVGIGLYSPRSQIRVRLLARRPVRVDRGFFAARIADALTLRRTVVPEATTGYRLINGEGDDLPGWTVDRFGDTLVSQITVAGLEALREEAYAALFAAVPEGPILQANDLRARHLEGLALADEAVRGRPGVEVSFEEHGLRFTAELAGGQKTGFYCDQRENRRRAESFAAGRTVLDLFAHTGAFGLYALRGGATRVVHVESSPRLVERGRRHYRDNGREPDAAQWIEGEVADYLRGSDEEFGMVVCDPPPFVRRRADVERGARAYKDLNRLALGRLAPGGLLFTFSCSGAVDTRLFRQILFAAAEEAGVRLALLEPLAAAPDHPIAVTHPEGEYLKGWLAMVRGPAA